MKGNVVLHRVLASKNYVFMETVPNISVQFYVVGFSRFNKLEAARAFSFFTSWSDSMTL